MGERSVVKRTSAGESPWPQALDQAFQLIVCDWDGTAVPDRRSDASALRAQLETLLNRGGTVVIVTGTHLGHVAGPLALEGHALPRGRLYAATNRGSEIFGFDANGRPERLWLRRASIVENERLDAIARRVQQVLADRAGLQVELIFDRLNRRKIDLIPLPEWRDPPKAALGDLLLAVQARLHQAGLAGGLLDAMAVARAAAAELGLPEARITSDVKHLEVGLTDKGDAMQWVVAQLVPALGLTTCDLLVAGDEFGEIGGLPGSDARLMIPQASAATFVSVGPEPGGVPPPVLHLPGGPARFLEVLARQADLKRVELPTRFVPTLAESWYHLETGYEPASEHAIESRLALSNGYLGSRGALMEDGVHSDPATFLAGVYAPGPEGLAELVRAPDWRAVTFEISNEPLRLDSGEILLHWRLLDMRRALLLRIWRHRSPEGRITRLHEARWVSLGDRHLLRQRLWIQPENFTGLLKIACHLGDEAPWLGDVDQVQIVCQAEPWPAVSLHAGSAWVAMVGTTRAHCAPETTAHGRVVTQTFVVPRTLGEPLDLERLSVAFSSRDVPDPAQAAGAHLARMLEGDLDAPFAVHEQAWRERWQASDVTLEGDPESQKALRFALFHLIGAAQPEDELVSIGARGLTGEAYMGHVFWDTEVALVPFYTLTQPLAARSLLMYRYHTLDAARERARLMGYRGALFAWESAASGRDETPRQVLGPRGELISILTGQLEHHVSAAVGNAVWSYWQATGDDGFMAHAGVEMLVEIARFWASRVEADARGNYHLRHVVGPDEYHQDVDDNAYTNGMARWILERASRALAWLQGYDASAWAKLGQRLAIAPDEVAGWQAIASRLVTGLDPATGLYEQFAGYFQLETIDLAPHAARSVPMDVLLGREPVERSQIIKQPDVLMLLALRDDPDRASLRVNYDYYEPRCGHGSSLSPGIHALLAARLGLSEEALRYFRWAAGIDLTDRMGNSSLGLHLASLGYLWQAVVFGFAGIRVSPEGLRLEPQLPSQWQQLDFPLRYRAWELRVSLAAHDVTLEIRGADPLQLDLAGIGPRRLAAGRHHARRQLEEWRWQDDATT